MDSGQIFVISIIINCGGRLPGDWLMPAASGKASFPITLNYLQ
ncbi:MAG TPA: hypothetical protein VFR58_17855 [Flavisolibacter sp.]|nr:hypothetical protein [Flavisolibacter sp.]